MAATVDVLVSNVTAPPLQIRPAQFTAAVDWMLAVHRPTHISVDIPATPTHSLWQTLQRRIHATRWAYEVPESLPVLTLCTLYADGRTTAAIVGPTDLVIVQPVALPVSLWDVVLNVSTATDHASPTCVSVTAWNKCLRSTPLHPDAVLPTPTSTVASYAVRETRAFCADSSSPLMLKLVSEWASPSFDELRVKRCAAPVSTGRHFIQLDLSVRADDTAAGVSSRLLAALSDVLLCPCETAPCTLPLRQTP